MKTWLNVGIEGAGVGAGVAVGAGVGVGVGVDTGVGVAVGLGVTDGVGTGLGFGVALLIGAGVDVACAVLVGFAGGVAARPGIAGVEDWDGPRATGGWDMDPGALCGPSTSDVIHKSNPQTAAQRTRRRSNHMNGTPPTHY